MKVLKPPQAYDLDHDPVIFFGGSIEMGKAIDWQTKLANDLKDKRVTILNPRRDDWDSSWKQDPTPGTQFEEQVSWELEGQEIADLKVYYFDPKTQSPITLLEIGLFAYKHDTIICCPKEFFRYGNVAVVCKRYGITLVHTYEELLEEIRKNLK